MASCARTGLPASRHVAALTRLMPVALATQPGATLSDSRASAVLLRQHAVAQSAAPAMSAVSLMQCSFAVVVIMARARVRVVTDCVLEASERLKRDGCALSAVAHAGAAAAAPES